MSEFSKKRAKKLIKKGVKKISEIDLKDVIEKESFIEDKIKNNKSLKSIYDDIKLLISVVKDYFNGTYKEIPYWSVAAVTFSLLYFLSPIDLLPDFIPLIGYVDDVLVLTTCYKMIKSDLKKYEIWKTKQTKS